MNSALKWHGGKTYLAPKIIGLLERRVAALNGQITKLKRRLEG